MNVCEAWYCCCGEIWSKRVLPLWRKLVKEKECAWRRRIYWKYASCKWLKEAGLEFTRADVVVSISRGPPGQWFPETEYWASAIFVGTSGIPPKLIYRSVKSYTLNFELKILRSTYMPGRLVLHNLLYFEENEPEINLFLPPLCVCVCLPCNVNA